MAGFFGFFDYTKPGPGVPKDAPPKARPIVFFEIYTRKFWSLVKLNLMFTIFNIPAFIAVLFLSQFFLQKPLDSNVAMDLAFRFIIGAVALCIPLVTLGPAQAGFTYILRNYSREEHAFLWGDFKEHALRNFKESMIICIIDFFVAIIVGIDINIYSHLNQVNFLTFLAKALLIVAFVIYLMMHMYIYPILVTFKLNVKQVYKNAFVFAIIKFIPNILVLLLCTILIFASFYYTVIGFILFPFITLSTIGLITNFYVYPILKKYMMEKISERDGTKEDSKNNEIEE